MKQTLLLHKQLTKGFTLVEIMVVVAIIGVLASIVVVSYSGSQQRAYDVSIASDADALNGAVTNAEIDGGGQIVNYSSLSSDHDQREDELGFEPSNGNTVDVSYTTDGKEYCIRVWNVKSNVYNSAFNAFRLASDKSVQSDSSGGCSYSDGAPPTVESGGAIPGAYETVYTPSNIATLGSHYSWPTVGGRDATRVEVAVIGPGGNGAVGCGGSGGGVSTAIINRTTANEGGFDIVLGTQSGTAGAQASSTSFGPIVATGGFNATNNCGAAPAGGTGTTTGGTSQKYGLGGNGGAGGWALAGLIQVAPPTSWTGGGGAGGLALAAGGKGANAVFGGGGGGGGSVLVLLGCNAAGAGGNPDGQDGIVCNAATNKGKGGAGGPGGGGGGGGTNVSGATGGAGGIGMVRVLTCFGEGTPEDTCNPEATPIPEP